MKEAQETNKSRVFVIHGRDEAIRRALFDFLRAIDLKPIEWGEAVALTGKPTPFVGEILDAAMGYAQAIIVLFTGDDQARLRDEFISGSDPAYERKTTPQSRPNVIFEAGLALGKYPERTILVQVGTLRPFSDIAGRHFVRLQNTSKSRQELAGRLKLAGCDVDLSGTDWHDAGSFS
ncbi:MAG: nucleotide-binding protein [Anaerolineales bacterium]|jgi:predicted nucleotide-binding protein